MTDSKFALKIFHIMRLKVRTPELSFCVCVCLNMCVVGLQIIKIMEEDGQ